ncbi:hypothetical protein HYU13_01955 [Candidatus Woesearchaeota archaeon]|nr:hypothetical protein [Candidatus Woesearchaeota archaeon]
MQRNDAAGDDDLVKKEDSQEILDELERKIMLSGKTALVAATQCTLDENVRMDDQHLLEVLEYAAGLPNNPKFTGGVAKFLELFRGGKLNNGELKGATSEDLALIEKKVEEITPKEDWSLAIGGSPAITAVAMERYAEGDTSTDVFFAGNLVRTVIDALIKKPDLLPAFVRNKMTDAKPRTLSLEDYVGKYRVMLPFSEGRNLSELYRNSFFRLLEGLAGDYKQIFLNIAGLNKGTPQEYQRLIEETRERVDAIKIYVGTNDFSSHPIEERKTFLAIAWGADFASLNDFEVRQLYEAVGGSYSRAIGEIIIDLENRAMPLGSPPPADRVLIVHSAHGAVIKPYGKYQQAGEKALHEAIQYAVDGTTFRLQYGDYPSRERVERTVTPKIKVRNHSEFAKEFGDEGYLRENGIIFAASPKNTNPLGDTTGAGATFDGLCMYYLSRLFS